MSAGHGRFWGMTNTPQPPAGWYPDPAGSDGERFWDGVAWSQATRDKPAPPPAEPTAPPAYGAPLQGHSHQGYPQQGGYQGPQRGYQQPMPHQQGMPYQQQPGAYGYGQGSGPGVRVGAFGWRLLAFLIDAILVSVVGGVLAAALGLMERMVGLFQDYLRDFAIWGESLVGDPPEVPAELYAANSQLTMLLIIVFIVYRVLMLGTVSATLGQMAAGLRVVKLGEGPDARLGWGAAVVRGTAGAFVYVLWYLTLVSGVCLLVNRNRQSLQDLVARTYVLKIR